MNINNVRIKKTEKNKNNTQSRSQENLENKVLLDENEF